MLPTRNYSARDVGSTLRPTSSALFVIDSEDRFANYTEARTGVSAAGVNLTDPYSFKITVPSSLMNGFFTRLALTEINFPWIIPNINNKTNKIIFEYRIGGVDTQYLVQLPNGFYTPNELSNAIQDNIQNNTPLGGLFTMKYGEYAFPSSKPAPLFLYDSDGAYQCRFLPMPAGTTAWPYTNLNRQLFDLLGFRTGGSDPNSAFRATNIGNSTYAQACRYVDIVCTQLTYNQALKDTGSQKIMRDALCRLYITEPGAMGKDVQPISDAFAPPGCSPTTIYRNFTYPKQIQWLPNQPIGGDLQFDVFDDEGDLLSTIDNYSNALPNGNSTNWSMTLLITEN
jgi:hypothetical protein